MKFSAWFYIASGVALLFGIVALNTWVVFFGEKEYSGGMLALSAVWFATGWVLLVIGNDK